MNPQACLPFLVEDDPDFRMLVLRAFEKAGVPRDRIRIACDGEEAIRTLGRMSVSNQADRAPSFVVLDLKLPKSSGFEVLRWIRESSPVRDIPVFMWTTSEHPENRTRAEALGTDAYHLKPLRFLDLVKIISEMLARWAAGKERPVPEVRGALSSEDSPT